MVDNEKIKKIVGIIVAEHDPIRVVLFGSCATGNISKDSDVDLIVIKTSDKPRFQRGFEIRKSLMTAGVPIDLLVYTPEEFEEAKNTRFSFLSMSLKGSKVLYEKQIQGVCRRSEVSK